MEEEAEDEVEDGAVEEDLQEEEEEEDSLDEAPLAGVREEDSAASREEEAQVGEREGFREEAAEGEDRIPLLLYIILINNNGFK